MQYSKFGQKLSTTKGILEVMDDLGSALSSNTHVAMLGGGNPAAIPEVQELFRDEMSTLLKQPDAFGAAVGNYDPPLGNPGFVGEVVTLLNDLYGWGIGLENVAVTSGSQMGFFTLFNLLAGESATGMRRILFPLVPEYIGYVDQGMTEDMFVGTKPVIQLRGEHEFKYGIDFDRLEVGPDIAGICLSRPTNPTGNVVTNEELARLSDIAGVAGVPLIMDNAYGWPFPGVITGAAKPMWHNNIIYAMSLSKVGLPATRVGIIVARPEICGMVAKATAVMNLASPTIGQVIARDLLKDGSLMRACEDYIRPYYAKAYTYASGVAAKKLAGLSYRLHVYEGSYFMWLWLKDLPIPTKDLYDRLKARGVIVCPGEYFFPGIDDSSWRHTQECLRLNFARPKREIDSGFAILAEEVKRAYAGS